MAALIDQLRAYSSDSFGDGDSVRRSTIARKLCELASDPTLLLQYGLDRERFDDLIEKRRPLPFKSPTQYQEFTREMCSVLRFADLGGAIRIIGTSTSLFSLSPSKGPEHFFDREPTIRSDLDVGIEARGLRAIMIARGIPPKLSKLNLGGTFDRDALVAGLPAVGGLVKSWETALARSLGIGAPADGATAPSAWLTDFVVPF